MARRKGDKIKGGKADNKKPTDFDEKNLKKGQKVEREHTSNKTVAKEIAMDHLTEDPNYYQKLAKMEGKKMFEKEDKKEMPEKKEGEKPEAKESKSEEKSEAKSESPAKDAKHLEHAQITVDLCNDCAPHLHHPQIPAASGHVEEQFDPAEGFEKVTSILGKK